MQKISIHIGINQYEPAIYGTDSNLDGCLKDADRMRDMAVKEGFVSHSLLDKNATTGAYTDMLEEAARTLYQGDKLLITHSGHGTFADTEKGRATALCFYNRVLWDSEQIPIWRKFRAGVRIIRVVDACYSQSSYRRLTVPAKARVVRIPGLTPPKPTNGSMASVKAAIISLSSSTIKQVSWETETGGAFTEALLIALQQPAFISYKYAREGALNLLDVWGYPQTPVLESSRAGAYKTLKWLT